MPNFNAIILIINIVSIFFLLGLSILLLVARKGRNTGIVAAIAVITTTIPIYAYNICFVKGWLHAGLWIAPFAYSAGTAFLPALWIFIHKYLNTQSSFSKIRLIHFLPTLACFIIYSVYLLLLSFPERINFILYKNTHMSNWIEGINITVLIAQTIAYSSIIAIYLYQFRRFIGKTYSEIDWAQNRWIMRITILATIAFVALLIGHHVWESANTWILNIFDILIMYYFAYHAIRMPQHKDGETQQNPLENIQLDNMINEGSTLSPEDIKQVSTTVTEYLRTSKTYLNPKLTIKDIADTIGISGNDISYAIKKNYKCSFFDFVNTLRIERAVRTINRDTEHEQNIDTITFQSGFTSRSAFHSAFKKVMDKTPAQYMKETYLK